MQIQKIPTINKQYQINKNAIDKIITSPSQTQKKDDVNGIFLKPYLPVSICDNLIYQNVYLSKCISTFSEDMIYNDININNKNNTPTPTNIIDFWTDNQEELCNMVKDYISYGFGAGEILFDENNIPVELKEISADTLDIQKINKYGTDYYYLRHQINGKTVLLRFSHLTYPEEDENLPVALWLGGGRKSNFFSYPCWLECFNHVSASVSLDLLDSKKLSEGNLISGLLVIKKPPLPINEGGESVEDTLEEKMSNKGSGIFTLELTTLNPNIPLDVDYIQISESNYTYLKELSDKSDMKILATFKIPKARLLIDDTTESMNSNKTNTLYKIYSLELNNNQRPIENKIRQFNNTYFNCNEKVEIVTPVFVDEKDIKTEIVLKTFNNGLITLGQAIRKLQSIYPEYAIDEEISDDNPIYNERYYNGQPLGLSKPTQEEIDLSRVGEYVDNAIIEEAINR